MRFKKCGLMVFVAVVSTSIALVLCAFSTSSRAQEVNRGGARELKHSEDYVLFVSIRIKEGKAQEYKNALIPYLKHVQKEDGIRIYKAHETVDDPLLFEIYAHFDSKSAHESHLEQTHTKNYLAIAKPLFEQGYPLRKKAIEIR